MVKLRTLSITALCVLCLALSGILVGCGGTQSPTQVADEYLKEMKSTSASEALGLMSDGTDDFDEMFGQEFSTAIAEKIVDFDYTLGVETINGDRASVQVTITTYNLGQAYSAFFEEYMQQVLVMAFSGATEDDVLELGVRLIKEKLAEAPKDYVSTVPMYLDKIDGKWVVDESDEGNIEIINALTGGILDAYEQIIQQYAELLY